MFANLAINGVFLAGIFLFWQCGHGLGLAILRGFKLTLARPLERILVATALGWTALGYTLYGLGLLHLIYWPVLVLILALLVGVTLRQQPWRDLSDLRVGRWLRSLPPLGKILVTVLALFALMNLLGALAPDIQFDSTWYHLPEAQIYLQEHHTRVLFPSSLDISSVAPRLPEILFMFLLAPASHMSTLPQLFECLSGLLLAAGTYALGRRFLPASPALLAVLVVYTAQSVGWLSQTAYVDLIQVFFGIAALMAIIAWTDEPTDKRYRPVIAMLIAGFLASKMQSLAFYPIFFIFLVGSRWTRNISFTQVVRAARQDVGVVALVSFLLIAPWYLEIWLVTGSPFFNFHHPAGSDLLGGGQTFTDWIFRIHPRTFVPDTWNILGRVAPLSLVALAAVLWWRSLPRLVRVSLVTGLVTLLGWTYIPVHLDRYGLLMFPLLAIPLAWLIGEEGFVGRIAKVAITLVILFNGLMLINLIWLRWPVALGRETRSEYLTQNLKGNSLIYYDTDHRIADLLGNGTALTLIHNPFYVDVPTIDSVRFKSTTYGKLTTMAAVVGAWKAAGITHLIMHGPWVLQTFVDQERFPGGQTALSRDEQEKIGQFVDLVYQDGETTAVWKLK